MNINISIEIPCVYTEDNTLTGPRTIRSVSDDSDIILNTDNIHTNKCCSFICLLSISVMIYFIINKIHILI